MTCMPGWPHRDTDGKDVQRVRPIQDRDGSVLTGVSCMLQRWNEYVALMNEE